MKIVSLTASNVKRLQAVHIEPSGNMVPIAGRNGAGKSSVLDSIFFALAGQKAIQRQPIRKGAERATITLNLGDFVVTRTMTPKDDGDFTTSVKVESAEGFEAKKPQAFLDALLGELSFDPLQFIRKRPSEQFDALKAFVPGVDFAAIARAQAEDYAERTIANRKVTELVATLNSIVLPEVIPAPVDEQALVQRLESAGAHNAQIETRRHNRVLLGQTIATLRSEVETIGERIRALEQEIEGLRQAAVEKSTLANAEQARLDSAGPLPDKIDTAEVVAQIAAARETNTVVARVKRREEVAAELEKAKAAAQAITDRMADRERQKAAAVAAADLPVPGLGFGDGEILLNGLPYDQASSAEQLRTAIAVAAKLNPKLRIIRVKDGVLLDSESMAILAEYAEREDVQVWIETLDTSTPGAIIIEDGHVAERLEAAE